MSGRAGVIIGTDPGVTIEPVSLLGIGQSWTRFAGPMVSVGLLIAVAYQFRHLNLSRLSLLMPTGIAFWLGFAVYYLISPASEWIMFRRLWNMPPRGFLVLVRKLICNEILMGYLGEVYFYAWARRNTC